MGDDAKQNDVPQQAHIEFATGKSKSRADQDPKIEEASKMFPTDNLIKYTQDDDEAMKALASYDGQPLILDDATNKRLLRTIDWHLMPIL